MDVERDAAAAAAAAAMAARPDQSLPRQAGAWPELVGTYRLLNNPAVTPEAVAAAHWRLTRARCGRERVVLCVQDTSDVDYTGYKGKTGLGPVGRQKGRGFLQHTCLAVRPNGSLLGVLHQRWQVRVPAPAGETRARRLARWNEGLFWADAADAVGRPPAGTRFVAVADRAADNVETFAACDRAGHDYVVRAQHDRLVGGGTGHLWPHMAGLPVARTVRVKVPARRGSRGSAKSFLARNRRPARVATVEVRFGRVSLDPPRKNPAHAEPRWAYVVYAAEVDPPAGLKEPIDWMLLTSLPVRSAREALAVIGYYRRRWVIEEYHKVQKSGFNLERSQLHDVDALRRLAAIVGVLAVWLLQVRDLAAAAAAASSSSSSSSSSSDQPAALQAVMPPPWIEVVARLAGVADPLALTPRQFWAAVARRGGWLGRKGDGRPGWQALWHGWREVALLVEGAALLATDPSG